MSVRVSSSPIVIVEPTRNGTRIVCSDEACRLSLDKIAPKLYDTIVKVREFFLEKFALFGLDGKGKMVPLAIKWNEKNAQWSCKAGSCILRFHDIYALSPEVVAHEYMHGVIQNLNFLEYYKQSGALNESLADVMGITFKQWLTEKQYWKISNLRDMSQYASMKNYLQTEDDYGGVHSNSAIPNHAFYLAVQNCNSVFLVAKIWFRAFLKVSHTASFKEFAMETVEIAKAVGLTKGIGIGVLIAWKDVGVLQVTSEKRLLQRWDERLGRNVVIPKQFFCYS